MALDVPVRGASPRSSPTSGTWRTDSTFAATSTSRPGSSQPTSTSRIRRGSIRTDHGETISARFCIMATGCLSTAQTPDLPGARLLPRQRLPHGTWPGPVRFEDQTVGIVGTGSSGIQVIPEVAAHADHLYVFQRTPNFSTPAHDRPLAPAIETGGQGYLRRKACRLP